MRVVTGSNPVAPTMLAAGRFAPVQVVLIVQSVQDVLNGAKRLNVWNHRLNWLGLKRLPAILLALLGELHYD